jgi:hypothetical protein
MDFFVEQLDVRGVRRVLLSRIDRRRHPYHVINADIGEDGAVDINPHGTGVLLASDEWDAFRDAVDRERRRA